MIRDRDKDGLTFQERLAESERFHMGVSRVHETVNALAADFERAGIDYAVIGGMALNAHGYRRETVDVDVLVRPEGLRTFWQKLVGCGYVEKFRGARKSFRNAQTGVTVEFLTTGEYPGDGKPKPVVFPDPLGASVNVEGIKVLDLAPLVELKLASGLTQPSRLKDLADVQELIRILNLNESFAQKLNPFVRDKFCEFLRQVHSRDPLREEEVEE